MPEEVISQMRDDEIGLVVLGDSQLLDVIMNMSIERLKKPSDWYQIPYGLFPV